MQLNSPLLCKFHLHSVPLPSFPIFSLSALCPKVLFISFSCSSFLSLFLIHPTLLPSHYRGFGFGVSFSYLEYLIYFIQMTGSSASFYLLPKSEERKEHMMKKGRTNCVSQSKQIGRTKHTGRKWMWLDVQFDKFYPLNKTRSTSFHATDT